MPVAQPGLAWISSFLDSIPAEIAVLDRTGTIVYVNREWLEFADRNQATSHCLKGANYLDICLRAAASGDSNAAEVAHALDQMLLGAATSYTCEYPCDSPAGRSWFRMILSATTHHDEHFILVQHFDITDRVEAEMRHKLVLDSVAEGIIVTRPDGSITAANPAGENLLAQPAQNLVGANLHQLLDLPEAQASLHTKCTFHSSIQGTQTLSASCFPFTDRTGNHFVWTLTDITAIEQQQTSLNSFSIGNMSAQLWSTLQESYRQLLDASPSAVVFEEAQTVSARLDEFALHLHRNHVSPHDLVRMHADVLHSLQRDSNNARARTLAEEGRMILLHLLAGLGGLYHQSARS